MNDLGTLGRKRTSAQGINNSGQVVGNADTASGYQHAFLYNGAPPLNDLGMLGGNYSPSRQASTTAVRLSASPPRPVAINVRSCIGGVYSI